MAVFKVYAGNHNPVNVYGCSPRRDPDCAQPENPVGYLGMHREYEAITWCDICRRIEKIYGCSCDDLSVGDTIQIMLVPSYSEVESIAVGADNLVDGFLVDVGVDDGINDFAPFSGTAWTSMFPEGTCSETRLEGDAQAIGELAGTEPYTRIYRANPVNPVMVGSRAGKVVLTINSLPEPGASVGCGVKGPAFRIRVNYRNHMTCCHCADCPGEGPGCGE